MVLTLTRISRKVIFTDNSSTYSSVSLSYSWVLWPHVSLFIPAPVGLLLLIGFLILSSLRSLLLLSILPLSLMQLDLLLMSLLLNGLLLLGLLVIGLLFIDLGLLHLSLMHLDLLRHVSSSSFPKPLSPSC